MLQRKSESGKPFSQHKKSPAPKEPGYSAVARSDYCWVYLPSLHS